MGIGKAMVRFGEAMLNSGAMASKALRNIMANIEQKEKREVMREKEAVEEALKRVQADQEAVEEVKKKPMLCKKKQELVEVRKQAGKYQYINNNTKSLRIRKKSYKKCQQLAYDMLMIALSPCDKSCKK